MKAIIGGFLLLGLLSSFWGCGLPSSAYINVVNLNKPQLRVYNSNDVLYLEITGYYPNDEHPNFLGYNIYVGDNNDAQKVIKRVMFISEDNFLPSLSVGLSQAVGTLTIPISEIKFRYSSHAKTEDIPEGEINRNVLFSKPLVEHERYYFVAEAVETTRTGIATEAIKTIFIKYKKDFQWDYGKTIPTPAEITNWGFRDLSVNKDYFNIPIGGGRSFEVSPGRGVTSVNQPIPEADGSYDNVPNLYKPIAGNIYFFRIKEGGIPKEYLVVWVNRIESGKIFVDYGYQGTEKIPDFTDFNQVERIQQ